MSQQSQSVLSEWWVETECDFYAVLYSWFALSHKPRWAAVTGVSLPVLYPEFFLQELRTRLNASRASLVPSVTNQVHLAARCAHETPTLRKGLKSAPSVKKKCIMQVHKPNGISKTRKVWICAVTSCFRCEIGCIQQWWSPADM